MRRIGETPAPRGGAGQGVPEWRVRASDTRCRADSPGVNGEEACTCTGLHPETPIASPPAASSPQTFRGNQLDNQPAAVWFHGVAHHVEKDSSSEHSRKVFPHAGVSRRNARPRVLDESLQRRPVRPGRR